MTAATTVIAATAMATPRATDQDTPGCFRCADERRREVVRAAGTLNGIDHLEVDPGQTSLTVVFLQPVQGPGAVPADPALTPDQVRLEPAGDGHTGPPVRITSIALAGHAMTVTLDRVGGYAAYRLRLAEPGEAGEVPEGFDTRLAELSFSLKAACATGQDCAAPGASSPPAYPEPALDYLAKDYASLRRLMLDRLSATLPGWTERSPADVLVTLVELLAYAGDRLSYAQDAIATEAHLGTARRRTSVRRHARLLDYPMSDGVSARTFLHFTVDTGLVVPEGTAARAGPAATAPVFVTRHPVRARAAHNEIAFHTWSDEDCALPAGATRATLVAAGADLQPGELLLLEEVEGLGGSSPDPAHRAVVRLTTVTASVDRLDGLALLEVGWHPRDALGFLLQVSVPGAVTAVARGNVALADHGDPRPRAPLIEETPAPPGRWRPLLPAGPVARIAPYAAELPARSLLTVDPAAVDAAVTLIADGERWLPQRDLLSAGPSAPVFVVEAEDDGTARVRFGDDEHGRSPAGARAGGGFLATCRVGVGVAGNVGAGAVDRLVAPVSGVTAVRNVLPGSGGADPEPVDRVRALAPEAFRVQRRAVVPDDYAAVAAAVPGVQRAAATMRWTGSWYSADVTVDTLRSTTALASRAPGSTGPVTPDPAAGTDDHVVAEVTAALERARMAGVDVEVVRPVPVPLDLAVLVQAGSAAVAADVQRAVERRLGVGLLPDGRRGFFHPDEQTLGRPVHLSRVIAAVLEVPGVQSARLTRFQRLGRPAGTSLATGILPVSRLEVAELDASRPDRGALAVTVEGGR